MVVYKAVVLSKLLHAAPAWWGFTSAADKQRLEASIRRVVRSGLYAADDPTFSQLVEHMDDNLFANIRHNPHHVFTNFYLIKSIINTLFDHVYTLFH